MHFWPQNTKHVIQEGPDAEANSPIVAMADHNNVVVPASLQSTSNVNQAKDFIRYLPPHLSMYILGHLDDKTLTKCAAVSGCWAFLAKEVKTERMCESRVQEKILYLQGSCSGRAVSNYAKMVDVTIPQLNEEGDVIKVKDHIRRSKMKKKEENLQAAYHDLKSDTIQLEERNVFCGSYNMHVLMDQSDQSRIIHYSGGNLVAVGSADRKVRLLGVSGMKEVVPPLLTGRAGSIKALVLNEKKGFVLSASFDLSIRCWNIYSGACMKIFTGHRGTITCLDLHEERFVSGARDGTVKVWNLESGKCLNTLKHDSAVCVVKMGGTHVVSGCDRGLVKVWCAGTGALIKTLEGHQGPVKCLAFDQWHLVTGSTDGYVMGWRMSGNLKRCLIAFRHPKEVLSLEFLYLRVITGCADGKIRIFNYLTGSCLKVLMVNSRGDPVSSLYAAGNRMVINSPRSLLLLQFEDVRWDYTLDADRETVREENQTSGRTPLQQTQRRSVSQMRGRALETQAGQQEQRLLKMEKACHVQAERQQKLFIPGTAEPRTFASGKSTRARSARTPADGKSEHGPSFHVPAHPDKAEATSQHEKRLKKFNAPRQVPLNSQRGAESLQSAPDSSRTKHTAKVREAKEHQQRPPEKTRSGKDFARSHGMAPSPKKSSASPA